MKIENQIIQPKSQVMKKTILTIMLTGVIASFAFTQNLPVKISGKITNDNKEPVPSATVRVKNGKGATQTDAMGTFNMSVSALPVTLIITSTGYDLKEITITSTGEVSTILTTDEKTMEEVTVNASGDARLKMRQIDIPSDYQIQTKKDFNNSPADPYGSLLTKRGLDVTVSSITFKTYLTRGFNGSGSSRVNQLMDGMDNQAPGLNFFLGNFVGLSDLDIESIEVLPGASSALYGPGGMNGTIIMNSKNPFKSPGLSILVKNGVTDIGKDQRGKVGGYHDYTLRWAKNFNNRFAFKISAQYLEANDWLANDTTNYLRIGGNGKVVAGTRQTDPNYDGVNVYGDETKVGGQSIKDIFKGGAGLLMFQNPTFAPALLQLLGTDTSNLSSVSRTGYNEKDVIDPKTKNIKLSAALHYKFKGDVEAIIAGHWAKGNTVYTGNNRYALKDITLGQYKLELRHKNWFLRGYTTQEDAGEAYSATVTTQLFNEAWKQSFDPIAVDQNPLNFLKYWYGQYAIGYWQSRLAGAPVSAAHNMARSYADIGRPIAGSTQFNRIFDSVRSIPIPQGGKFLERSQLWMGEGQYNVADRVKFAEIIVGANAKKYFLDSDGTLFIDSSEAIKINEWGVYAQATKKLLKEKLVLTATGRFDKNENFKGKFSPRIAALISLADNHKIRLSYQTAYRFPSTQQQWIRLNIGDAILIGGLPWILNYIQPEKYATYVLNTTNGSVSPWEYKRMKPETMSSFEVGYKSLVNKKLLIDGYAYFGSYKDFLGRIVLVQPTRQTLPWSIVTNSDTKVNTWGAGVGFDYKMNKNFFSFFNAYTDNIRNVPNGFQAGWSTPKYRLNAGFGNSGLGKSKKIGFNVNLRWQDEFYWESGGLADGTVKAYTTLDAQVNYKIPKIKSMIKIGGTNITNKFYQTGFGNPNIGGMYYISFGYNIL